MSADDDSDLTRYRREHVGFVFQFYNLIPSLTARENVALVTEISRDPMPPDEALEIVGLGERMDHFPSQLSGGEQQRVTIARAIAKRPSVLLCDEPTGPLDVRTGVVVLEAIDRVNRELGTTYRFEARIITWQQEDVLKIPTSALFCHEDEWAVFRVVNGRASLETVLLGERNGLEAQVLGGLKEGATVIVHPSDKLAPGTAVVAR